jgi:hypothetical protein
MNEKSFIPWVIAVVAAQASMILYLENSSLKIENRLCQSAGDLLRDEVSDLNSTISRLTSEKEYVSTRSYVLGATQAMNEPKKFGELWHDGYSRGLSQTQYVSEHYSEK